MSTTFVDAVTTVTAAWFNAADAIVVANAIAALQPLAPAANKLAYYTGSASAALTDISDFWVGLLGSADASSLFVGLDAELAALASVTSAANKLPYFTGSGTATVTDLTSAGRALLDDADAAAQLTTLGISAFVQTILNDANAGAVLTTLGISAFAQTLLDDADAAAARTTLGIDLGLYALIAGQVFTGHIAAPTFGFNNSPFDDGNTGASKTIDFSAYQYHKATMTGNCTFTFTAPTRACVVHLELYQDGTGSRVMTLPASVKWPSTYVAADKLLSTAASSRDLLILRWNGTDYIANLLPGIA